MFICICKQNGAKNNSHIKASGTLISTPKQNWLYKHWPWRDLVFLFLFLLFPKLFLKASQERNNFSTTVITNSYLQ